MADSDFFPGPQPFSLEEWIKLVENGIPFEQILAELEQLNENHESAE